MPSSIAVFACQIEFISSLSRMSNIKKGRNFASSGGEYKIYQEIIHSISRKKHGLSVMELPWCMMSSSYSSSYSFVSKCEWWWKKKKRKEIYGVEFTSTLYKPLRKAIERKGLNSLSLSSHAVIASTFSFNMF